MSTPTPQPTVEQVAEMGRLRLHFPFRLVWGALSPTGEWRCAASFDKREPNKLARAGWNVYLLTHAGPETDKARKTSKAQPKCSRPMWNMLNNLVCGRDPWHGVKGTTANGERTLQALYTRGWTTAAPNGIEHLQITEAGRAVWAANKAAYTKYPPLQDQLAQCPLPVRHQAIQTKDLP